MLQRFLRYLNERPWLFAVPGAFAVMFIFGIIQNPASSGQLAGTAYYGGPIPGGTSGPVGGDALLNYTPEPGKARLVVSVLKETVNADNTASSLSAYDGAPVSSDVAGISGCAGNGGCVKSFLQGASVTISIPYAGSGGYALKSVPSACTNSSGTVTCALQMNQDRSLTFVYGKPSSKKPE